jgi:Restriction endonuclease
VSYIDWRDYEDRVAEILRARVGDDATIEVDVKLPGRLSGEDRQIDVVVRGSFLGLVDAVMVVDCKLYKRAITVPMLGSFVDLVEDVGADLGLVVTSRGFSKGAARRAANARGIHVEVVPIEHLPEWEPPLLDCQVCGPEPTDSEKFPGMLWLDGVGEVAFVATDADEEAEPAAVAEVTVGFCEVCGAGHFRCPNCGHVTGVPEVVAGSWQQCDGYCGLAYYYAEAHPKDDPAFNERLIFTIEE